jgi:hypothetical protein
MSSRVLKGSFVTVVAANVLSRSCVHSARLMTSISGLLVFAGWMGGGSSSGNSTTVGSEGRRPIDLKSCFWKGKC